MMTYDLSHQGFVCYTLDEMKQKYIHTAHHIFICKELHWGNVSYVTLLAANHNDLKYIGFYGLF